MTDWSSWALAGGMGVLEFLLLLSRPLARPACQHQHCGLYNGEHVLN